MVSGEDAEFHEGIKRVVSLCFLDVHDLAILREMVDVDVDGNQRHVG